MKKKLVRGIVLLLVAGLAAYGIYSHFHKPDRDDTVLALYGNVDIRQVMLAFHDTGRILAVHVREGDKVSKGQLVAELDPVRYEAALEQAKAEVGVQKEVLDTLLAGSRPEEIKEAGAKVAAAEAAFKEAGLDYGRAQELASREIVSQQELDAAEKKYNSAKADLNAYRQSYNLAVKGPRKEDIRAARAKLKALEAALALAQRECDDTRLYAAGDGVIENRIMEPGDMASPGTPVLTLALTDPVWVRAYVDEPDLGRIHPGMKAEVSTDSFPGKVYDGWIGYISPTSEFTPKQVESTKLRSKLVYQVRVYVKNPQDELRLGMPATVTIRLDRAGPHEGTPDVTPKESRSGG